MRSAVIRFVRPDTALRFVLYPMVHLGEPDFHREVTARLRRDCDLVIAEGVGKGSRGADALVASYARMERSERLGPAVQDIDHSAPGVPVICPDTDGAEFEDGYRWLPLKERALPATVVPAVTAGLRLLGTRRRPARRLATEDLLSEAEEAALDVLRRLDDLVVRRRDRLIVDALTRLDHDRPRHGGGPFTVAVVHGAAHMRAAADTLTGLGHHAADAEWPTVISVEPEEGGE